MRKMKKINGYLVVKFNARELREYEGTALGEYGVIDAELYTGNLDVDRGAMEYDNAGSMEEAVELARGLESELDAEEPEVKVTIVKETDETTEEEEVDAQQMIAGWENVLRGQVASAHYKDVDERTAAHELYGYKVALRDLGLLDREDCYVLPDTFGEAPGPLPKKPEELLAFQRREALSRKRLSGDPRNPFRPRYGAELTFAAASQEAETLGYILKLLEKEAARECARRVFPTLDAILDFVVGLGLMALGGLGLAAACVVAGAPDSFTRAAALLGLGFMAAVNLHRQKRK